MRFPCPWNLVLKSDVYINKSINVYAYKDIDMCLYLQYIYTCMYIYICICTYLYVCMCIGHEGVAVKRTAGHSACSQGRIASDHDAANANAKIHMCIYMCIYIYIHIH